MTEPLSPYWPALCLHKEPFLLASQKNTRQWHKVSSCKAFCAICLNINLL